jgi:Cof subfamily protein (haloacid dehalogenase superfamily)
MTSSIRLLLADVDGTLVTPDKVLTERTISAVDKLHRAGIHFAITSGRPPRGMAMLFEPLHLSGPIAGFNGGVFVRPDMSVIERKALPGPVIVPAITLLTSFGLDVWLYSGTGWYVQNPQGPHVHREASTVRFAPTVLPHYDSLHEDIVKIVGVSDDHESVAGANTAAQEHFLDHASASRSQPYYLDITHPEANKGNVITFLAGTYGIPTDQIATIGDMPNDVLMFAHSGFSIAMGNASREVQRAARCVTTANDDEGFANAVNRHLLHESVAG